MTNEATLPLGAPEIPVVKARPAAKNCKLCYGPHDAEIHEATASIHQWLKDTLIEHLAAEESGLAA